VFRGDNRGSTDTPGWARKMQVDFLAKVALCE
jgi:hypothetical protein